MDEETKSDMKFKRNLPRDELDFQLMTTEPAIGKEEVTPSLKGQLQHTYNYSDGTTANVDGWQLFGYYNRDIRLGNLSEQELTCVRHYMDLAGDCLRSNLPDVFLACHQRVATIIETSQSKKGFFRKLTSMFLSHEVKKTIEPKKNVLFGMGKGAN
jgi:hypothetical protein